jgi:hypothetical protein
MYAEPSGMTRIFSENFGQYVTINETAPHRYTLELPDGKDNIYTYHNGKCVEVEVRTSLATVYIKLRKKRHRQLKPEISRLYYAHGI